MFAILRVLFYVILGPVIGGLLAGVDRKLTARLQGRQGPPLLQPFYDLFKLFSKQSVTVNYVQDFLVMGFLFFMVFTGGLFFYGGDLLLVFFALTLAGIFLIMAAASANSEYSAIGSQRELMQMMAYEPMVLLTAIGFYVATGSFSVGGIVNSGSINIVQLPGFFIGFIYILTIKLRKSPFDLSTSHHAHQELTKGITTEMTGYILGLVEIAHWYENVFLLGLVSLFIINGSLLSYAIAAAVCGIVYFLEILIDNTFPRVKWDVMLKSAWLVTLIAGVINLVVLTII